MFYRGRFAIQSSRRERAHGSVRRILCVLYPFLRGTGVVGGARRSSHRCDTRRNESLRARSGSTATAGRHGRNGPHRAPPACGAGRRRRRAPGRQRVDSPDNLGLCGERAEETVEICGDEHASTAILDRLNRSEHSGAVLSFPAAGHVEFFMHVDEFEVVAGAYGGDPFVLLGWADEPLAVAPRLGKRG